MRDITLRNAQSSNHGGCVPNHVGICLGSRKHCATWVLTKVSNRPINNHKSQE